MSLYGRTKVRIRDAKSLENTGLQRFHFIRLSIALMIESKQMQGTVHEHMRPVILDSLALLKSFRPHHWRADDDIT